MDELVTAIVTGITAFSVTNIDDIVVLGLFFSQVNSTFRRQHIVAGQYLGFTALVVASLFGFLGGLIIPRSQIGLLGLMPIIIGLGYLLQDDDPLEAEPRIELSDSSLATNLLSPQTYSVAAITIANGGDNISVYIPLFASSSIAEVLIIFGVFFLLVGVWCYAANKLASLPAIARTLTDYGNVLVPFVLIGLGGFIIWESHTLENPALRILCVIVIYLHLTDLGRREAKSQLEQQ